MKRPFRAFEARRRTPCALGLGIALTLLAAAVGVPVGTRRSAAPAPKEPKPPYLNPDLDVETRARDLVSRMTVAEKVSQLTNQAAADPAARACRPTSGGTRRCTAWHARASPPSSRRRSVSPPRSTRRCVHETAVVIGNEGRAKHHQFVRQGKRGRYQGLTFWSPNINIFRDPRWGRGQETYGEDPYLTARMGVAFVKGLQGDDPRYYRASATAKHFAVHSGPEQDRHHFDARPSERDLHETYLPAFRALVVEGKVESVMGAYNRVNGESASASQRLLLDILRDRVGLRRPRGLGLRRDRRHLRAPQARRDAGGGRGARGDEGLRPRVRQRLQDARDGARARPAEGERPRRGAPAADARAAQARDVRSAGAGALRADPVLGERRARARPPRAQGGAGVDGAAEERRDPAAAEGHRHDRRGGAERRRPGDAARQLPRDAVPPGHDPGRDPERRLAPHARPLRARGGPGRGPAGSARGAGDRLGVPAPRPRLVRARAHGPVLPGPGAPGRARADARRSQGRVPLGPRRAHRRAGGPRRARRGARARRRQLLGPLERHAGAARLGRVRADGDRQRRRAAVRGRAEAARRVERDERGAGRERARERSRRAASTTSGSSTSRTSATPRCGSAGACRAPGRRSRRPWPRRAPPTWWSSWAG